MVRLSTVQEQADQLTDEDREGLLAYLIHRLPRMSDIPDDEEASSRDSDLDSGRVTALSHDEFLKAAGFRSK